LEIELPGAGGLERAEIMAEGRLEDPAFAMGESEGHGVVLSISLTLESCLIVGYSSG
jgi:hypothetical protein